MGSGGRWSELCQPGGPLSAGSEFACYVGTHGIYTSICFFGFSPLFVCLGKKSHAGIRKDC